jgi:serine/threonine-protein kinase
MPEEPQKLGKYTIVGKIGRGAMGEIYKGHDPLLNRYVAIKTIADALGNDADLIERFRREARSAAQLNHPNIVTIFEFVEDENRLYMVMELLEGQDLKQLIQSGKPLTVDQLLGIMEQIADGLSFAHEREIVHRDLKPANIHISKNGQVKILDFGLVHEASSDMTRSGHVLGTPNYMSPEQVQGLKIDARSDVFSLGAVFYELLTRKKPFSADSVHATMFKVVQGDREPLSSYEQLPDPIVRLVERALEPAADNRFRSAIDLREQLRNVRQELAQDSSDASSMTVVQSEATLLSSEPGTQGSSPREPSSIGRSRSRSVASGSASVGAGASMGGSLGRSIGASRAQGTVRRGQAVGASMSMAPADRPVALYALLAVLAVGIIGGGYYILRPSTPEPGTDVTDLSRALVDSQQRLMLQSFEQHDYQAAISQAEELLANDPGNQEARRVQREAEEALAAVDTAVTESRAAIESGNMEAAADALARVLELDPEHPAGAELAGQLDQHFQGRAENARADMERARAEATRAGADRESAFREADGLMQQASADLGRGEYTNAAQRFLGARDRYRQATSSHREAEANRRVQAEQQQAQQQNEARASQQASLRTARDSFTREKNQSSSAELSSQPSYARATADETRARQLESSGDLEGATRAYESATANLQAAQTELQQARARAAEEARREQERQAQQQREQATAAPTTPAVPTREQEETAIREVLSAYERAIETEDIDLYRRVKPNLTSDEESRLRRAFNDMDEQRVELSNTRIQIQGDQATVDVTRSDTIVAGGRTQEAPSRPQRFTFSKSSGSWVIVAIGN